MQRSSLPLFGELYPDRQAAGNLAAGVWGRSAAVAAAIALGVALTAGLLLPLLYGRALLEEAPLNMVLTLILPIQVARMVYRRAVLAFKRERDLETAVGVNLGLDLLLTLRYGAMGCALTTVCTEARFAFLPWQTWRKMSCA